MTQWLSDYERLAERQSSELGADELQQRATAAYMLGRYQESVDAWDRAHSVLPNEGDAAGASRCLFWLLLAIGEDDVSAAPRMGGQLARIQRLVEEFSLGELEQTYLDCYDCIGRFMSGEYDESVAAWARIAGIGRAHGTTTSGRSERRATDARSSAWFVCVKGPPSWTSSSSPSARVRFRR